VSGGKDSTRQALFIRDALGLNPLLVCLSYPPEQVTTRGTNNISNLINLGFDLVLSAPAPRTWRSLKREGFFKFINSFRSTELALFSSVPQIAIQYGIQTIFWGENPGLQLGDMKTVGRTGYDGNNLRYANTLSSGLDWIIDLGYSKSNVIPYIYPTPEEFEEHEVQIIYLGWFWKNWSLVTNALYACGNGIEIRTDTVEKTGDLYGITALDEEFTPINQMIKYFKFGFGRVTDYVNEDIRLGRISREKGIEIVEKYDSTYDNKYVEEYCHYLEITTDQFWDQVMKAVDKNLFTIKAKNKVVPKFKVGTGL
jgi:hypothetical protein